jgi:TonB family protein
MYSSLEGLVTALWLPVGLDAAPAFLVANAWKATLILVAAFGAAFLLRRASASLRHLLWSAAVVCIVLLPLVSLALPSWRLAQPAALAAGTAAVRPLSERFGSVVIAAALTPAAAAEAAVRPSRGGVSHLKSLEAPGIAAVLIGVWALGFCLMAARLGSGVRRVREMARGAQQTQASDWSPLWAQLTARLALRRPVALLRSTRVTIPMTAGFRRPVILLPKDADEWPAERRWVVLAHELLHVQRADYCLWMLARLACALYWFHPLVWLAAARLRQEAEQACDDGVLRLGAAAPAYAEHLVSLARGWSLGRTAELSAMAMAQPSHLESRVRALLDPARNRREVSRRGRCWIALAAALVLAPLAAVRAPAQAQQDPGCSLRATVSDSSGARLPGAFVTVQRLGDQSKAVAVASDAGEFAFASLPAGQYVIEIRKPGFRLYQQTVELSSGAHESLDITVDVGSVSEQLEIVGKAPARAEESRPAGPRRRIRVGGNVQASRLITEIRPVYPEELQREGVEGMVVLDAVILTDGSLGNLRLANDLVEVDQRLVDAATEAVRFWRYKPTLLNGLPVEVVTTITLNFRLER